MENKITPASASEWHPRSDSEAMQAEAITRVAEGAMARAWNMRMEGIDESDQAAIDNLMNMGSSEVPMEPDLEPTRDIEVFRAIPNPGLSAEMKKWRAGMGY